MTPLKPFPEVLALTFVTLGVFAPGSLADFQNPHPNVEFKIFQFPRDAMPRLDGDSSDWEIVPDEYTYGTELLNDTEDGHGVEIDRKDLDVKVTVGWVKGMNRLYFLYEAHDDFWDFERTNPRGYLNDIFEIAVDGDRSGGPFILNPKILPPGNKDQISQEFLENHIRFAGVHAQNYHIYTPPVNNAWVLVWGAQPWIGEFPYSNHAFSYDLKHGESGKLILECWITPFDYAPFDRPEDAVETKLEEGMEIGLSWSILDFDGDKRDGHYNLAHNVLMVKDATYLLPFRLAPIEATLQPDLKAEWTFKILDVDEGMVSFHDESIGNITSWNWDFGDGTTSNKRNPIHEFGPGVRKMITLKVTGPKGSSKRTRYWDVITK